MKNHLIKLFLLLSLILTIFLSPYKIIFVQGKSMYPTLDSGQILLGVKTNKFDREDIIVAYFEDSYIIKRIKFVEGDYFYHLLNFDSELPILVSKNFYDHYEKHDKLEMVQKNKVDNNKVFLLGDNLDVSDDSRRFGCIDINSIKYKIIWPRL